MDVMNDNYFDYVVSLIIDVFMFTIKSIFIFAETLYLTLLPDRFRKLKVLPIDYICYCFMIRWSKINI